MKHLIAFTLSIAVIFTTVAQTREIDSVLQVINNTTDDSTRAEALGDISWLLKYSDPTKAINFGRQGAELADKKGFDALKAHALNSVGVTYWAKGDYDSARLHIEQVGNLYKNLGNVKGEAVSNTNLGLIYQNQGNYQKALDHALIALRLLEKLDDKGGIASSLLNIGNVYFLREEFKIAKQYYFRSLALKRELARNVMGQNIQKTLGNLANVYQKLGQNDSAFFYFKSAIPYAKQAGDLKNLCLAYTEIGLTFSKEKNYDSALYYYNASLSIYQGGKFVNEYDRATLLQSISETYLDMGDLKKSVGYAEESLSIAKALNNNNKLKEAYELLALVYEKSGKPAMALNALKSFIVYNDSLVNAEKNKQIAEIQTKFETEKKDSKIALLNQENELKDAAIKKRNWLIATLALAISQLVVGFVIWRKMQRQKQIVIQQAQKLMLRDAQMTAEIESQENERKRFAQDLHDGMGQSISALKLILQTLSVNATQEERVAVVEKSEGLLNEMHREIRRIAFNLMPHVLVQNGLVSALNESIQRINSSGKISITIQSYEIPERLLEVQEISLYRITQEWINNILKYAQASSVDVQLVGHESEIIITIEDDGNGFDPAALDRSQGNGWKNIRSRMNLIKGTFELDSNPQRKGTTLVLRIPIKQNVHMGQLV